MTIKLSSMWSIPDPKNYKIHFAKWNGKSHPLDALVRDRDKWQTWHEWMPAMNAFNRSKIFALAEFYDEPETWMFGGIFEVLGITSGRYNVRLLPDRSELIGRLKLTSSYNSRNVRVNFENHYNDLELKEILSTPYTGGSGQILNDPQKYEGDPSNNSSQGGQGYQLDPALRKAIELHAMEAATKHYERLGYTVKDVSRNSSYDLVCTLPDSSFRRVEVKGTKGTNEEVIVTIKEVEAAREPDSTTDLFVFAEIKGEMIGGQPLVAGGKMTLIENWHPAEADLSPTQFRYSVPAL